MKCISIFRIVGAMAALAASTAFAETAYALRSAGFIYEVNDVTGAATFLNDIGSGSWAGLASRNGKLYTVKDNTSLMSFVPGATATFQRNLPFIGTGILIDIAIDGGGVGWAIVERNSVTEYWSFGLITNETLRFSIPFTSSSAIDFDSTGSLYVWNATANAAVTGLNVVDRTTGEMTKVNPNTGVFSGNGLAITSSLGGHGNYLSAFNDVIRGAVYDDGGSVVSSTNLGFRAIEYLSDPNIVFVGQLGTVNLGTVTKNNLRCLEDEDNDSLRVCKSFIPTLASPFARFEVNFDVGTSIQTLSLTESARTVSGGSFHLTVEGFDPTTSTFVIRYTRPITTTESSFAATLPLSLINASHDVKLRFSVRQTGLSATATPCAEFDQIVCSKT